MAKSASVRSKIQDYLRKKDPLTVVTLDELYNLSGMTRNYSE